MSVAHDDNNVTDPTTLFDWDFGIEDDDDSEDEELDDFIQQINKESPTKKTEKQKGFTQVAAVLDIWILHSYL